MTYYPIFVEKQDLEHGCSIFDSELVHLSTSKEEAIDWIKSTDPKKIIELSSVILPEQIIRVECSDCYNERFGYREFFTDEASSIGSDNVMPYRYKIWYAAFDNEYGLISDFND